MSSTMPSSEPAAPHSLHSSTAPSIESASELSDDALLASPLSSPSSASAADPLHTSAASASSTLHNGFAQGHAHLQHPSLTLSGISHIESFLPSTSAASADSHSQQSAAPSTPTAASLLGFTTSGFNSSDGQSSAPSSPATVGGSSVHSSITTSPSIGSLAAATFASLPGSAPPNPLAQLHSPTPQTPTTPTGYAATNVVSAGGPNTQPNGHPNFFPQRAHAHATNAPLNNNLMTQLQPIQSAYPPQPNVHPYVPPPYTTANQQGQQPPLPQQPPQPINLQQQQRPAVAQAGAKSGFFSRLMNSRDQPAPKPVERPLPVYMQRLRRTHDLSFHQSQSST